MATTHALPLGSADLVWQVVRRHNSFTKAGRTDNGVVFTSEPGNLVNLNRRKFSGLGNVKTVSVVARKGKRKGETLVLGNTEVAQPQKAGVKTALRLNNKRSFSVARSKLAGHRPDLTRAALARIARISKGERAALKKVAPTKKE